MLEAKKFFKFAENDKTTMKEKALNTENRIKAAARKIFMQKDYKGTTSRDIAKEAGLNVALTNYYFRKKEKLFQIIFMDVIHEFLDDVIVILNRPIDLRKKIRLIIEREIAIQKIDPDFFIFIYSEIKNDTESFLREINKMRKKLLDKWSKQINENIKKKIIRKIDPLSALSIVLGYLHFPIIASPILKRIGDFNDKTFEIFLEKQKEYAIEMITKFLFLKKE